jgi:hypothetical protein
MKRCSKCKRTYDDENYCPQDGALLQSYDSGGPTERLPENHPFSTKANTSMSLEQSLWSIQESLKQINNKLTNSFRFLKGEEQIYDAVAEAISKARHKIRIVRLGSRPIAPKEVLNALIERVKAEVPYEIVIVLDPHIPIGGFEAGHKILKDSFGEDEKLRKLYKPLVLETNEPICFDTLIIDNIYVGIGFIHITGREELQDAIMFQSTEVADNFVAWFDDVIKDNPNTVDYYEWEKRKGKKRRKRERKL